MKLTLIEIWVGEFGWTRRCFEFLLVTAVESGIWDIGNNLISDTNRDESLRY